MAKHLDDTDEIISRLSHVSARLPTQTPPEAAPTIQPQTEAPPPSKTAPTAAAPAAPHASANTRPAATAPARPRTTPVNPAQPRRPSRSSYTLPPYAEAQLREAAFRTGLSKGALLLKAMKADGYDIRDEDIRDKRRRPEPEQV